MIPDLSSYWLNLPLIKIEHLCYFGIRMIKLQIVVVSTLTTEGYRIASRIATP